MSNKQGAVNNENSRQMTVTDRKKEFEIDLEEDNNSTYFFNSKDLNLLAHLQKLIKAGITSFKIEGRNKSVYYLATVVRAYHNVLNCYNQRKNKSGQCEKILKQEQKNLNDLVHRGYTEGFLLGKEPGHNFANSHNKSNYEFVGEVLATDISFTEQINKIDTKKQQKQNNNNLIKVKVHNAIYRDDKIEVIDPSKNYSVKILAIYDEKMKKVNSAHGGHQEVYYLKVENKNIQVRNLLRKKIK
jgi:putative protease